jgi:hypothetical protein
MVSEGVQTNGFARSNGHGQQISPPVRSSSSKIRPPQPPLPPYQDPPPAPPPKKQPPKESPQKKVKPVVFKSSADALNGRQISPYMASQLPGYKLQVYHIDGDTSSYSQQTPASWYATAPRSGKHQHHHSHHKHSHHSHQHVKAGRSQSSGNVLEDGADSHQFNKPKPVKLVHKSAVQQAHRPNKHLQKSYSDGELLDEDGQPQKPQKAVKFVQEQHPLPAAASAINLSEDEVSDRDLPELAPITPEDYIISAKQKSLDDELEADLGNTLSPLGSTSSLQDLIESSSARGSVDPGHSRNHQSSSAWIDRERQQAYASQDSTPTVRAKPFESKCVTVIEPPRELTSPSQSDKKQQPTQRMDSVNSAKTNETSTTTATSEDYATAPEVPMKSTTEEEDEGEDASEDEENVEEYLESPEREEEEMSPQAEELEEDNNVECDKQQQQYTAVCEMQLKTNQNNKSGLLDNHNQQVIKSPTHSLASSSSAGSYSVTNTENGKKNSPPKESPNESLKKEVTIQIKHEDEGSSTTPVDTVDAGITEIQQEYEQTPEEPETPERSSNVALSTDQRGVSEGEEDIQVPDKKTKRKHELTLDLDLNAPPMQMKHNLTTSPTCSEESSETSMIWQRLPLGTGDVKRKRQAFEQQIRALSMDEHQEVQSPVTCHLSQSPAAALPPQNGAYRVARQIINEDAATSSPGLARSPAMHQGFRQEEWHVERTPVNTPDTANDKVVIAMINLSDDEETSNHLDSDVVFKSSTAATTPQEGSLVSSLGPSSVDLTQDPSVDPRPYPQGPTVSISAPAKLGETTNDQCVLNSSPEVLNSSPKVVVLPQPAAPTKVLAVVDPPAGFGDSPEHRRRSKDLPGFHEAVSDQPLPQEELLMASEELVSSPALHITETFQQSDVLYSSKKSSIQEQQPQISEPPVASTCLVQSLDRQISRKLSSTSTTSATTSRPSTSTSRNRSRSRSCSKERLLSTLSGSENAPQTSHEKDEVSGNY